jgi:Tfp pilus assembly protein PilO
MKIDTRKLITQITSKMAGITPKITQHLTKITQDRNKLVIAISVIALVLLLDFSLVLRAQTRALRTIKPKIAKLRTDLKNLNIDSVRMQRQEEGLSAEQAKNIVLPGQIPWVIEEISRLANQQKVKIFQIKPAREMPSAKAPRQARGPEAENYSSILIDLDMSSGYHQLGRFLAELENHPVFLQVEDLDISQDNEAVFEHKIKLRLKTYVSK